MTQQYSKCRLLQESAESDSKRMHQTSSKRLGMTGSDRWTTRNCARDWNVIILINASTRIPMRKCDTRNSLEFQDINGSLNPSKKTRPSANYQENIPYHLLVLTVPADHRVTIKDRQIHVPDKRNKKAVEHEVNVDTNFILWSWNGLQRLEKRTGGIWSQENRDHPDYSIFKIS